jgi:hypothetical protein
MQPVHCPVCKDLIALEEWRDYVNLSTLNAYRLLNKPFSPITRACPCNALVMFSKPPLFERKHRLTALTKIHCLLEKILIRETTIDAFAFGIISQFEELQTRYMKYSTVDVSTLHENLINDLKQTFNFSENINNDKLNNVKLISGILAALELDGDKWTELNFKNTIMDPFSHCDGCQNMVCFSCGENHDSSLTCFQYSTQLIIIDPIELQTRQWRLNNSNDKLL